MTAETDNERVTSNLHEKIAASKLLSSGAQAASKELTSFSSWLMAGVGAAFALIASHLDVVASHVELKHVQFALVSVFVVLCLGVLIRWIGASVAAGIESGTAAELVGGTLGDSETEIDLAVMLKEFEKGLFWPSRLIAASSFRKALAGDLAVGARFLAKASQVQGWLVLLQLVASSIAVLAIALGLKV